MHLLSRWNPPSGAVEMATVISALVLLRKIRCMLLFTVKTCSRVFASKRSVRSFFPFCQSFSVEAPYILQALPIGLASHTVFDLALLSQWHNKHCIPSRTL